MSRHRGHEVRQGPKTGLLGWVGPPIDLSTVMAQGRLFGLTRWRTGVELHLAGLGTLQEHTHKHIQAAGLAETHKHKGMFPQCLIHRSAFGKKTKMSVHHSRWEDGGKGCDEQLIYRGCGAHILMKKN